MRIFFTITFLAIFSSLSAQTLSGSQLLSKAIAYHDPNGNWAEFSGDLRITLQSKDKPDRVSNLSINLVEEYFQHSSQSDGNTIVQAVKKDSCSFMLNGSSVISDADMKKHRMSCNRANLWKNYYTYLYGLPMKLKDPGTHIDPVTERREFKGKEYLVLRATFDASVGTDVWYFYFDPQTYAMEVYQFFKQEAKNDGEYILLSGIETISGVKMPKTRKWYYNNQDGYLGTDVLSKP